MDAYDASLDGPDAPELNERVAKTLLEWSGEGTWVHVEVYVDPEDGRVVMAGQDLGAAPLRHFDRSDHEYFLDVDAGLKDRLIVELMVEVFGGNRPPRAAIAERLDERGIPYSLASW